MLSSSKGRGTDQPAPPTKLEEQTKSYNYYILANYEWYFAILDSYYLGTFTAISVLVLLGAHLTCSALFFAGGGG